MEGSYLGLCSVGAPVRDQFGRHSGDHRGGHPLGPLRARGTRALHQGGQSGRGVVLSLPGLDPQMVPPATGYARLDGRSSTQHHAGRPLSTRPPRKEKIAMADEEAQEGRCKRRQGDDQEPCHGRPAGRRRRVLRRRQRRQGHPHQALQVRLEVRLRERCDPGPWSATARR